MRVLVCGGRDFGNLDLGMDKIDEWNFMNDYLTERLKPSPTMPWWPEITIIHGAAKGADLNAHVWAMHQGCKVEQYPANWKAHGRRAGYLRNKQMLEEGKPDLVIAFPGGKGTANMVKLAKEAGVPVEIVEYKDG
jgi:hypothetical protein